MGKTTIGNYLARERGFEHLDFEHGPTIVRFLIGGEMTLQRELDALRRTARDLVVTWGFLPDRQLQLVLLMCELGFEWVWLDGDRGAARRAFLARGDVPEPLLDLQLQKIADHIDLSMLRPLLVNTFDKNGQFRRLDDITAELLAPSMTLPQPEAKTAAEKPSLSCVPPSQASAE